MESAFGLQENPPDSLFEEPALETFPERLFVHRDQSQSYIEGRLKILKADTRAIFSVASYASQAADWLMHVPKPKEGQGRGRHDTLLATGPGDSGAFMVR